MKKARVLRVLVTGEAFKAPSCFSTFLRSDTNQNPPPDRCMVVTLIGSRIEVLDETGADLEEP